jgi:hypothetical protein
MLRTIDTWLISDATEVVALVEEVYQSLLGCDTRNNLEAWVILPNRAASTI